MEIELTGTIRGEHVRVVWTDGVLRGNPTLLRRVRQLQQEREADLADCTTAIRTLELAAAQRLELKVLDPTPSRDLPLGETA